MLHPDNREIVSIVIREGLSGTLARGGCRKPSPSFFHRNERNAMKDYHWIGVLIGIGIISITAMIMSLYPAQHLFAVQCYRISLCSGSGLIGFSIGMGIARRIVEE